MSLKKSSVIVTGADGFLGSHLVERLVEDGARVKAFVHYNSVNSWGQLDLLDRRIRDSLDVVSGDIRDAYAVKAAIRGCDVVFHLAALIAIPYSYQSPESFVETNIRGTLNVLNASRELNVKKIVHTSTSEVYGTAQYVPIDEEHPLRAQSPYAATKIGADQLALSLYRCFETPVAVARPFNAYGPRQSARAVIPTIITQIASGSRNIRLGSLATTRDFNYVKDLVDGFIKIAESTRSVGEVVNLGTGREYSIGKIVKTIVRLMHADVRIVNDTARLRPKKSEVMRLVADNSKAKKLLNWKPKYSLEEGLEETIQWFSDPRHLARYKTGLYNI